MSGVCLREEESDVQHGREMEKWRNGIGIGGGPSISRGGRGCGWTDR